MYVRFPLSLRNVEDFLHERGNDICHETVCYCRNKFGPLLRHMETRPHSSDSTHALEYIIDTQSALEGSDDLIGTLKSGTLPKDRIAGGLFGLCKGEVQGRYTPDEFTHFKGVGSAIED